MNEQLQGKLVEILSGIQTATKAAGDFAMEQLPDIAQSYVMYGRASLTLFVVLGLAILIASVWQAIIFVPRGIKKNGFEVFFPSALGGVVGGIVGFINVVENLSPAMLVWFAPKVWLLKELAGLIK